MHEQAAQPMALWGSLLGYCRSLRGTRPVSASVNLISQLTMLLHSCRCWLSDFRCSVWICSYTAQTLSTHVSSNSDSLRKPQKKPL